MKIARLLLALSLATSTAYAEDSDALYKQGLALKQEGKVDDAIKKLDTCAGPTCQLDVPGLTHPT